MQLDPSVILKFMKDFLNENNQDSTIETIEVSTDLVAFGIESIVLLTLIVSLESSYGVKVNLDKLEHNCFLISAQTLFDSIDT